MKRLLAGLLLLLVAASAWAHKGSDAYLDVRDTATAGAATGSKPAPGTLRFTYAVAIKDLDQALPLDANADGKVTWGEMKAAMPAVLQLLQAASGLESGSDAKAGTAEATQATQATQAVNHAETACHLAWTFAGLERRSDGGYMRFTSDAACTGAVGLHYTLFRGQDATHRLLVTGNIGGQELLSTWSPQQAGALSLRAAAGLDGRPAATAGGQSGLQTLWLYLAVGVQHLLQGYDHLAFLLALVLPLRLAIRVGRPAPSAALAGVAGVVGGMSAGADRATWLALLRTITAFTIGHSVTLVLATLGLTEASPAWVEPAIALSIGFTALHNLFPMRHVRTDVLALVFGMVHGFGFASLLTEAAAPSGLLPWALAGFNLGVECGQLLVVAGWVLLSQVVQRQPWYGRVVMRGGSCVLVLLAAFWFWQRIR
ncbi:MAG: hypothetical protein JWP29_4902 [Rhodoferax sp.]|nr:hypothetical protein [Rhodoferax sp.]